MNGEIMLCTDGNYSIGGEIDHVGKREREEKFLEWWIFLNGGEKRQSMH